MQVNKHILVTVVVIFAGGVVRVWVLHQGTITKTMIGALVFMLILSVLDIFGGPLSSLASALAMLALVAVLLDVFLPVILQQPIVQQGGR